MTHRQRAWSGAGLGLRRELIPALQAGLPADLDFMEVAPENWAGVGGPQARYLQQLSEQVPIVAHGLSLNLGGYAPLDMALLADIKAVMQRLRMPFYSEHLAWTGDDGHLYDLMPLPFTMEAVRHVSQRVRQVQDFLGCAIGVENVSYYMASPLDEMTEIEFLLAVQQASDCDLHLDVNNVYVNSVNHGFDAQAYIAALPSDRIRYIHVAGHWHERDDLLIDTHGSEVIDPVWDLLACTYRLHGTKPTLLERDFNIPALETLMAEVRHIRALQDRAPATPAARHDALACLA